MVFLTYCTFYLHTTLKIRFVPIHTASMVVGSALV